MTNTSLIVDLDHTLINTDLLFESSITLIKRNPFTLFAIPFWLIKGMANLKQKIADRVDLDIKKLPYNKKVIEYINIRKSAGDNIILATASHYKYANQVADYLNIFDGVLATDAKFNLSSHNKAKELVRIYGEKNFDYIGDHKRDIPVWDVSNIAILVNVKPQVENKLSNIKKIKI